jgi:hypothetical protein
VGFLWLRRLPRPQYYNGVLVTGVDYGASPLLGKTLGRAQIITVGDFDHAIGVDPERCSDRLHCGLRLVIGPPNHLQLASDLTIDIFG